MIFDDGEDDGRLDDFMVGADDTKIEGMALGEPDGDDDGDDDGADDGNDDGADDGDDDGADDDIAVGTDDGDDDGADDSSTVGLDDGIAQNDVASDCPKSPPDFISSPSTKRLYKP